MSRVAIVTGGSSGIGKALCAALVAGGDEVVVAARTEADVRRTAAELSAQGPGRAIPAVLDVRDAPAALKAAPYSADRLARQVLRDLDRDKAIIVRPASARALWLAYRLSPRLAQIYGRKYVAWAMRRLQDTTPPSDPA